MMLSDLWVAFVRNEIIIQASCLLQGVVVFQSGGYHISGNNCIGVYRCFIKLRQDKSFRCLPCFSNVSGFLISKFPFQLG